MRIGHKVVVNVTVYLALALTLVSHELWQRAGSVMDSDPQPITDMSLTH